MFKIHIDAFPDMDGFGFWFLRYDETKRYIARINGEGCIDWEELKDDCYTERVKPTFFIGGYFSHEFMQIFAEALDEKKIKTDRDAKIQGTLEAQRYHLEDLRKLLKLRE